MVDEAPCFTNDHWRGETDYPDEFTFSKDLISVKCRRDSDAGRFL